MADSESAVAADTGESHSHSVEKDSETGEAVGNDAEDSGGEQSVEFNLSNADELSKQLEKVDLTQKQSDELLNEAYRVNKRLKMILKQQEKMAKSSKRAQSAESSVSKSSGYKVLPPISGKGRAVPTKPEKPQKQSSSKPAPQASKQRTKSAKTAQKPQWDDRFVYS